jgi:hypothetical protein
VGQLVKIDEPNIDNVMNIANDLPRRFRRDQGIDVQSSKYGTWVMRNLQEQFMEHAKTLNPQLRQYNVQYKTLEDGTTAVVLGEGAKFTKAVDQIIDSGAQLTKADSLAWAEKRDSIAEGLKQLARNGLIDDTQAMQAWHRYQLSFKDIAKNVSKYKDDKAFWSKIANDMHALLPEKNLGLGVAKIIQEKYLLRNPLNPAASIPDTLRGMVDEAPTEFDTFFKKNRPPKDIP